MHAPPHLREIVVHHYQKDKCWKLNFSLVVGQGHGLFDAFFGFLGSVNNS